MRKFNFAFFALVLFFALSTSAFSQETKALFKEGNRLFKLEHYRKALPFLEKVVEAEPNNAEAVFEAGVCYLHRYSKEKALDYLLKSYTLDSNVSKYIHFWLGRAYHQNYMYDKAISEYTNFKDNYRKVDQRRKDVEKHIIQTNNARELTRNPENYKVINLGPVINSIYSEHSPVTSANDSVIYFTSRRHDVTGGKEDLDGEFYEDIFMSKRVGKNEWSKPEPIPLNTSGHDASIQLFDNDSKLLIYREAKGGDIFVSERDPQTRAWKDPVKFANINTTDFEADAFITPDGKTAYFATNHFKKTGDLDIYYVTLQDDGTWSKPKELLGRINTPEDEDAPYLSPDGKTLYFSSRGHKNMGGFDVFKSTMDDKGNWSAPVNLGFPINTPDDDVYYYMSSDGRRGYLSSYREGGFGEKDIYVITPLFPVKIKNKIVPACEGPKREQLMYVLKSADKVEKPVNLTGKVQNDNFELSVLSSNSYKLSVYNSKDTLYTKLINIPEVENANEVIQNEISIECPEPIKVDSMIAANQVRNSKQSSEYLFRNIHFKHGSSELTVESKKELEIASEILKKNPTAVVKLKGMADGDEKTSLASKRAKAVHDQLVKNGVKNILKDTVKLAKGESKDARSTSIEADLKESLNTDFNPAIITKASVGDNFVLRNVNFTTGKSELNQASKEELNILVKILTERPEKKIEIAGHTDEVGNEEANQKLSETRAQIVKEYLVMAGIDANRLTAVGYGESQPMADNKTEAGRAKNRRTEIRILIK